MVWRGFDNAMLCIKPLFWAKRGIYLDRASMHFKLHIFEVQLAGST